MVHGMVMVYGFEVSINNMLYYLDGGVFGLVGLDLEVGVWFWMRYGDVISVTMPCTTQPALQPQPKFNPTNSSPISTTS